jgi:ABC-2 type transport system permease protein
MKLLRDTWLLFARGVMATLRNPVWVVMGLFQPVCYMLLFAPLLDGLASAPGFPSGGGLEFFTPGVLVMLGTLSAAFTGFGLISDLRTGVIERFRVTPVHRLALPFGSALRDVTVLVVQSLLVLLVALPLGLHASVWEIAVSLALIVLIGLLMASCSYALALTLKDENALASLVNFLFLPLLLLSGIFLPLTLAPD